MNGGNSSNNGSRNNGGGDDDGGWGSKFLKVASAAAATAAVAGGLYALLTSSSSEQQQSPLETRARRVIKEPDDDDRAWSLHHDHESTPPPPSQIRWTKPEFGWVKLNVDGSRDHIGHPPSAGCGGVLRDSSGTWLLGFAQKLDPNSEVHVTEIEAILKGLELAFDMNIEKLVVESDNESVVSMVENGLGGKYNHPQFNIINSIRQLRFDPKWQVKVVHVPREANGVANRLAKDSRDLSSEYLRKYPYPPANCTALVEEDAKVRFSYF